MAAVVVILVAAGPLAIRLWTGNPDVVPGRWLLLAVGGYYLVRTFTECFTIVLYGLDRQRELFPAVLANGVLVVGLGILLGRPFGVLGVAASNVLAFALTQGIWVPLRARAHLALFPLPPQGGEGRGEGG
jgi:O-antigen/teichoic acid export membrane protein